LISLALLCCAAGSADEWSAADTAETIFMAIVEGEYAQVEALVDEALRGVLNAELFEQGWDLIVDMLGEFESVLQSEENDQGNAVLVQMVVQHAQGQQITSVMFNETGQVISFTIMPIPDVVETPPLPLPESAIEEPILLRPGAPDETGGLLVLPSGTQKPPAVVLIHGSGASDRDETVFGVKPFRDIAIGLAEHGIASLRYDKYAFAHPALLMNNLTIDQEYVQDVKAAVALLGADDRIGELYLLGHSEGGMLIPRLLTECGDAVTGGIILAGSPRPLWEIQKMQNEDAIPTLTEEQQALTLPMIAAETEKGERLSGMTDEELQSETVFGIPAAYHMDLMRPDPVDTARSLSIPLFILQGEMDFQVRADIDYAAWQEALSDLPFVSFSLYEGLSHLFMELRNEYTGTIEDYGSGGHIREDVIADIASWILGEKTRGDFS
ncbi:MAG: alpha/beta fold hydrolase, partial [Clostridia bacterium]|nr:alpha/beta fold hydrolase [Clostridia bacterium]